MPEVVAQAEHVARQYELQSGREIVVPAVRPKKLSATATTVEKALRQATPNGEGLLVFGERWSSSVS